MVPIFKDKLLKFKFLFQVSIVNNTITSEPNEFVNFMDQDYTYAEKDNEEDELSERDVAVLCRASEDYEENKEQCDKLYDMLEEGEIKDDSDFEYD